MRSAGPLSDQGWPGARSRLRRGRHRCSAASSPRSRPVARSARVSSRPPAWETTAVPSADTMILEWLV
jgi:hypothetical protein